MDFNKLNYLLAVAELKSFSKAAEACFISQPALTRCIKNIEAELGVKLFDRSYSPIRLTYAGEKYVEGLKEIMVLKQKLDTEMADIADRKRDRLVLGIPTTRAATWLPRVLPTFVKACPHIDVQMVESNTSTLEQLLLKGSIDLFLMGSAPVLNKGIVLEPLFREKMMLVVSRQADILKPLLLPPNRPDVLQLIPPKVLEQIPYFSATPSQNTYYVGHQMFDLHDIRPVSVINLVNSTVAYQMAPSGGGFALAPAAVANDERFSPEPLFCTLSDQLFCRTIGVAYCERRALSDAAKIFMEVALRQIKQYVEEQTTQIYVRHDIDFSGIANGRF